ncbi:histone-lysine N-methyltransferase, H3 lysine-9 specific SUVH5 [Cajanus cajan]|uniref:Histone-lysine N-methyltransferase, H3 lysine-9 specific SUVH5 n=1 Tax=Cajanus cajan TaxID=3821 RepID=A0A151QWX1_CAJCA|nr:histone-lysine N-methyltransferase, H3 lysine-9 specific SUVH5 [Cajanus cajan]XP_020206811.1 histone-lysine N-methyltransferase, H3 lysine-9 specific SUVH5 [Cajanus cajan]KYP34776.1 Histone-lysine N-methyltransferase, H3 lysine-9 specific SUVH5 [Cajanus cajan]
MDASKSFARRHEERSLTPSSASVKHRKVKQALVTLRNLFHKLMHQYNADQPGNSKGKTEVLVEAAMIMQREHQWENTRKIVGHVSGIEVGDRFQYRAELNVIGLHRQFSNGIDYMSKGSSSLATSVVVTNRYDNVRWKSGMVVYIGHGGGNPNVKSNVSFHDQKLERGNLALKNSMDAKSPVRVILKVEEKFNVVDNYTDSSSNFSYVYDGLYFVDTMIQERGRSGKFVFKFILKRMLEQPQTCVALKGDVMDNAGNSGTFARITPNKRHKSRGCLVQKDVVRINDISEGKEKFPIRVVTPKDCVQILPSFNYIVGNIYSEVFTQPILCGCDCADGCVDHKKCACNVKNGGRMPYDCNKRLASLMESSLIYECGPSCRCSSSCTNRVSQHGIQFQLEIFMTKLKGWGVRARSFIPSRSFVCAYLGEVRNNRHCESRPDFDDYILKIGVGKGFIDASRCGNIGRFINHSCSPNLIVKDVTNDHSDKNLPYKVLFAVKDIPAGRELSYDYNSSKGKFMKVRNNSCYCEARECNGKIYI